MAIYAGLSPADALNKWYQIQHTPDGQLSVEERADKYSNMVGLSKENPEAWKIVKSGVQDPKDENYYYAFNPGTGQWDRTEHKGYWSHPESWIQAGAGAGLAAVSIPSLIGSGASAAGGSGAALDFGANLTPEAAASGTAAAGGAGAAGAGAAAESGLLPSTATVGNIGTLPSVAPSGAVGAAMGGGGALAAGKTILGRAMTAGKALSPILGGAAANAQNQNNINDRNNLERSQILLGAPQKRLNTSVNASITANAKPVQIRSGPSPFAHAPAGSSMIHFDNSLSPALIGGDTKALANQIMHDELTAQMRPDQGIPEVGQSSLGDKVLGGAALGSSILGAGPSILSGWGSGGFDASGAGSTVTGNYNPQDYIGINPNTGLYDPNFDPNLTGMDPSTGTF
jgi:hypothetical protein